MFGPLFGKELLEMARRRRYFIVRVAIGVVLLAGWYIALQGRSPTVSYKNLASLSAVGEGLFRAWASWSLWGVVILTPMLVSGVIAAEKDGRTFEILLTTLLTNREILVGKAVSRLLLLLILLASSVPILAVASLYGGFDVAQVAIAAAVISTTALFVVVVSLYYSSITFKPYIALMRTYFFLAIIWWLLPALSTSLYPWTIQAPWQSLQQMVGGADPYRDYRNIPGQYIGVPLPRGARAGVFLGAIDFTHNVVGSTTLHIAVAAFLFWRTNRLLRRRLLPGKPPWIFTIAVWLYRALITGARRSVEKRKSSFGWSGLWSAEEASERFWRRGLERAINRNPLLFRNRVANAFDPERFVATIQLLVGFGGLASFLVLAWKERAGSSIDQQFERLGIWGLVAATILLLVCSAILAASAFARERQYGSWEVLLLTDLPPRMHLTAALVGVLGTLRMLLIVVFALIVVVGYVFSGVVPTVVWTLSVTVLWLLSVLFALWTSLFHRRIAGALSATLIGLGVLLVAPPILAEPNFEFIQPQIVGFPFGAVLTLLAWWLARRAAIPWAAVHALGTLTLACLIATLTADQRWSDSPNPTRIGDYYVSRWATSAPSLVLFPLSWGRRFAYGLTESIPDPAFLFAFLLSVAVATGAFLASFPSLAAADPSDRTIRHPKRTRPRLRHAVG